MRLIEDGLPPFEPPPITSNNCDSEPAFFEEWSEARLGLSMIGRTSISLLSDTLKIYFKSLEQEFGFKPTQEDKNKIFKTKGFLNGYKHILSEGLDTDWSDCPVDFELLEQLVLARNISQHSRHITSLNVSYDRHFLEKYPKPFFVEEWEKDIVHEIEESGRALFAPNIEVTDQDLLKAIEEVETLAKWIVSREAFGYNWRKRKP